MSNYLLWHVFRSCHLWKMYIFLLQVQNKIASRCLVDSYYAFQILNNLFCDFYTSWKTVLFCILSKATALVVGTFLRGYTELVAGRFSPVHT